MLTVGLPWQFHRRLRASNVRGTGLLSGWGNRIPHTTWHSQKKNINYEKQTKINNTLYID